MSSTSAAHEVEVLREEGRAQTRQNASWAVTKRCVGILDAILPGVIGCPSQVLDPVSLASGRAETSDPGSVVSPSATAAPEEHVPDEVEQLVGVARCRSLSHREELGAVQNLVAVGIATFEPNSLAKSSGCQFVVPPQRTEVVHVEPREK